MQCKNTAKLIDLYAVIYNQINRYKRVNLAWIAAQPSHGVAQGGQIDHAWYASKVLQHDAGWLKRNLDLAGRFGTPLGNRFYRFLGNLKTVGLAQGGFEQHFH